jgi:hypothetical protein
MHADKSKPKGPKKPSIVYSNARLGYRLIRSGLLF